MESRNHLNKRGVIRIALKVGIILKKNNMKKFFVLLLLFFVSSINIFSQSSVKSDLLFQRTYNRNSISFLILQHDDDFDKYILDCFKSESFEKYNLNKLPFETINTKLSRSAKMVDKVKIIEEFLNKNNVGKLIIESWFERSEDGILSMKKIKERGVYNASDYQTAVAEKSTRGDAMLMDAGESLIERSYIVVFDLRNISKSISKAGILTWSGDVETYLFSVAFDESIKKQVWDCWIDENNIKNLSQTQISKMKKDFDIIPFEVNCEDKISAKIAKNTNVGMLNFFSTFIILLAEVASGDSNKDYSISYSGNGVFEFYTFMENALKSAMESIEKKRPDFKVKTAISEINPIRAKIGQKEGLKSKQMYEAYEGKYNEKTDEVESKYIGTLRATNIANNSDSISGKSLTSEFVTVFQKKTIEPNMFIQQKNDKQISWFFDGAFSGNYISSNNVYNLGMQNLNFMTTKSFSGSLLIDLSIMNNFVWEAEEINYSSFYIRMGYIFGINAFHPNFKFSPFLNLGAGLTSGVIDYTISYGAKAGYTIFAPLQVYFKMEKISNGYWKKIPTFFGLGIQYSY